ncbi:methyltransferase domain-containing protein [Bacillus mangrovi]|uniref:Methyltransferase domain-containing protein n=1 Tax=Metabacillus mangrovi TaxID=1491830 RepID=A0A7X2S292_9BACI|nr:class I SAM-dependent methyltransferase [Metabacillus mangrovi]MTH51878.1 methyltransferase domain-containing protein [Metabacillus mangrovi]
MKAGKNGKLIQKYNKQAEKYDRIREKQFQKEWRENLLNGAQGEVLEIAVGAGGNFPYYKRGAISSITAVDFSPAMLEKAREAAGLYSLPVNLIETDIYDASFKENSFDTIVSTLSLCGYPDPLRVLKQLQHWCRPDGSILLLEHGISRNAMISFIQKAVNPLACKAAGCFQDRDIMEILSRSPLEVIQAEHHWKGIFHLIWARPGK